MAGYERQSSAEIIPGATVRAAPINAEYNQLDAAFAALTGHKHDGTTGEGGYIPLIADADAKNKVVVDTGTNTVTFFTEVGGVAVAQVVFKDGAFVPATDNDIDLGSATAYFKDAYIKGNMQVAAVTSSGNISPATTATYDLGSPTFQWRDVHVSGTVDTTAVVADTVKLNGGTGGTTGTLSWNAEDGTADLVLENGVTLQLGQEEHLQATNTSGGTITDGQVVRITGSSGSKVTVSLANASSEATSQGTIAVATNVVANNAAGYFTTQGMVRNVDTSAFAEGAPLYLATTNGGLTTTRPVSPNHLVIIGWCVRSHPSVGSIFVKVTNGWELEELHDVKITSVADKDFLRWNNTVGVWENTKDATFTSGSIDNVTVGATTPATGKFTTLTSTGNFSVEGNTTIGNATSDTVTFTARVNTDFLPSVDGTYDLGSSTQEWQDLWVDGTANIDSLVADTADINGGTIDGASAGATTPLTYARVDQLAIDNSTISATGVATNIDITLTPKGTGHVFLPKVDINAGNIDGTVIGAAAPTAITGSTITANTGFSGNITSTGTSSFSTLSVSTAATVPAPTADTHASTKKYVDDQITAIVGTASTTLDTLGEIQDWLTNNNGFTDLTDAINSRLSTTGGTLTGQLAMSNNKITGLGYPSVATDAASKAYVDDALDPFQDQYLGAKATDPAVDNDGDPLLTGALYFDSTNGVMKVYNGTEWQAASSSIEGIRDSFYYTATGGQTLFVGSDDNLNLMVVDKADLVSVYLNGVRLIQDTDYTVSVAGDSITLTAGATAGDLVEVEVFGNFAGQAGSEVSITGGSVVGLSALGVSGGNATFGDNDKAIFGAGSDLQIYSNGDSSFISEQSTTGSLNVLATNFYLYDSTFAKYMMTATANGAVDLRYDGTAKLTTTSTGIDVTGTATMDGLTVDGNVGIGTAAPAYKLDVRGTGTTGLLIGSTNAGGAKIFLDGDSNGDGAGGDYSYISHETDGSLIIAQDSPAGSNIMTFRTGDTERARLDASGNLLVGTTSTDIIDTTPADTSGVVLRSTGRMDVACSDSHYFNRVTTDGSILTFRKDGADVGSIGVNIGDLTIGTGDTGILFHNGLQAVFPFHPSAGTSKDGQIDLGTFANRFKDLYLSGKVITGGNTTSNVGEIEFVADNSRARIIGGYQSGGGGYLKFHTDTTGGTDLERMRLDNAGNLLVGTTDLNVSTSTGSVTGTVINSNGQFEAAVAVNALTPVGIFNKLTNDGDIVAFRKNGATVGIIGTYLGDATVGTGAAGLRFFDAGPAITAHNLTTNLSNDAAIDLGTSANRFKDLYLSGNTYSGKTTTAAFNTTVGCAFDALGYVTTARSAGPAAYFNRTTSDGDAVIILKDGTTVGSIGTDANSEMFISGAGNRGGIGFYDRAAGSAVQPVNSNGTARDALVDLGIDTNRWRDLYLSGGVYVGGTGAANHLDDYETGLFTVTATPSTSGTITLDSAIDTLRYVKVGDLVTVHGILRVSTVSSPAGNSVSFNLPFASANLTDRAEASSVSVSYFDFSASSFVTTYGYVAQGGATTFVISKNAAEFANSDDIYINFSYSAS